MKILITFNESEGNAGVLGCFIGICAKKTIGFSSGRKVFCYNSIDVVLLLFPQGFEGNCWFGETWIDCRGKDVGGK